MLLSILTIISLLFAATASTVSQLTTSSPKFHLMVQSKNATLNGTVLIACHAGAATKALCTTNITVYDQPSWAVHQTTFYHNTSSSANTTVNQPGKLCYDQLVNGNESVPSTMSLPYSTASNISVPIITPGSQGVPDMVLFDKFGRMGIRQIMNVTTYPPTQKKETYRNWHVCVTYWAYRYETLAWVDGKKANNPTCQKVEVKRVFA
jgi:hypothetical protein